MKTASLVLPLAIAAGCVQGVDTSVPVNVREDLQLRTFTRLFTNGLADEIVMDLPHDLSSMLIEVRGGEGKYFLTKFKTPSGELIERGAFMTEFAREVPGLVDWMYPNSPDLHMEGGTYKLLLRGEGPAGGNLDSEQAEIRVYTKKQQSFDTCGIYIDFLVDTQTFGGMTEDQIDQAIFLDSGGRKGVLSWVNDRLYNYAGMHIQDHTISRVTLPTSKFDAESDSVTDHVDQVLAQARLLNKARPDSIHVILVKSIGGSETFGYSMGLPGPYDADRPNAAVLISMDGTEFTGGLRTKDDIASTIAHEIGHYFGLYHTSESDGSRSDPIPDTPECTDDFACSEDFNTNMMTGGQGASRDTITEGQAFVMRNHPLCHPFEFTPPPRVVKQCTLQCDKTAGETCSVTAGEMSCRQACEYPNGMCTFGTCQIDALGATVCMP